MQESQRVPDVVLRIEPKRVTAAAIY